MKNSHVTLNSQSEFFISAYSRCTTPKFVFDNGSRAKFQIEKLLTVQSFEVGTDLISALEWSPLYIQHQNALFLGKDSLQLLALFQPFNFVTVFAYLI